MMRNYHMFPTFQDSCCLLLLFPYEYYVENFYYCLSFLHFSNLIYMELLNYIGYKLIIAINFYSLISCINSFDGSLLNNAIDLIRDYHIINANI